MSFPSPSLLTGLRTFSFFTSGPTDATVSLKQQGGQGVKQRRKGGFTHSAEEGHTALSHLHCALRVQEQLKGQVICSRELINGKTNLLWCKSVCLLNSLIISQYTADGSSMIL